MNTLKLLVSSFALLFIFYAQSQDFNTNFGLKAGINYSNYASDDTSSDYSYQVSFYAGVFLNLEIDYRFKFQPEILFSLNRINNS